MKLDFSNIIISIILSILWIPPNHEYNSQNLVSNNGRILLEFV
jgi:hypothetical protein